MMAKIKTHMQETKEWGQPFPANLSPFPYNTTLAHEHTPLTKKEALEAGFMWHDETNKQSENALTCAKTGEPFQIIAQEAKFYEKFNLPKPKVCPEQRYQQINKLRPPNKLRKDNCHSCQTPIHTAYPKSWGLQIICHECYKKIMF